MKVYSNLLSIKIENKKKKQKKDFSVKELIWEIKLALV